MPVLLCNTLPFPIHYKLFWNFNHICIIKILTKSNQSVCWLLDFIAIKTIKNYSWRDEAASLSSHFTAFSNIWHSKSQSCRNSALFAPFFTLFKLPFKWIWKAFSSQEEFLKEFNLKMGVGTMEDRKWEWGEKNPQIFIPLLFVVYKIRRGPKLEDCAFDNFGNTSGTEEEPSQIREKKSMLPRPGIELGTRR